MKYVSTNYKTVAQVGNSTVLYKVPFSDGVDGINIKTIRVESDENVAFVVSLLDSETGYPIYESLEELKIHYDQVDIPFKPVERNFFIRIFNKSNLTTKFTFDIKGIEVN